VPDAIGVEILGETDELVVFVIVTASDDGWTVHIDRDEETEGFDVLEHGRERVMLHVPRPGPHPAPDNVTSLR